MSIGGGNPGITFKGKVASKGVEAVVIELPAEAREYLEVGKEYIFQATPVAGHEHGSEPGSGG